MKALLYGNNLKDITPLTKSLGIKIVNSSPEVIISYGGDGTLLSSERKYPGIPKLPIRDSQVCRKCLNHQERKVLDRLLHGKLPLKEHKKLHTNIYGKDLYALNDFVVRNSDPAHTIRFQILQDLLSSGILIGDGIVVATPFGSTGYFKSITRKYFEAGFGLAFNNTTERIKPLYLDENDKLTFQLIRGKATLTLDNDPHIYHIPEGTRLSFEISDKTARIYSDSSLRCPNCQVIRG